MEDEGPQGTKNQHFEKLVFGDEIMVFNAIVNSKFSKMTLAVAKDSGFYEIDLTKGDYFTWGKGHGCSLLNKSCNQFLSSEICVSSKQLACDSKHRIVRECSLGSLADNCGIFEPTLDCRKPKQVQTPLTIYGPKSVCMTVTVLAVEG